MLGKRTAGTIELRAEAAVAKAVAGTLLPGAADGVDELLDRLLADPEVDLRTVAADWRRDNTRAAQAVERLLADAGVPPASDAESAPDARLAWRAALALTALGFTVHRAEGGGDGSAYEGGVWLRWTDRGLHMSWTTHQSLADADGVGDDRLGALQADVMVDVDELLGRWLVAVGFHVERDSGFGHVILEGPPDGWRPVLIDLRGD